MSDATTSCARSTAEPPIAGTPDVCGTRDQAARRRLPAQLTTLLGREDAVSELSGLLWRRRLVTLYGPGGVGKTRLALALAEAVQADFVEGAWWVDLSATSDPGSVARLIADAVAPDAPSDSASEAVARTFADSSLLVLDNCEQVSAGCAEVVIELLGSAQSLRVIATSREPLGVPGEQLWRVPGLLSGGGAQGRRAPATDGAAVELFLERAGEWSGSFDAHDPDVREAVGRICRRLDGIPLAIELAAAQVTVLAVAEIAERLERGARILHRAGRVVPERHRTLRDALEWSHRLLERGEQRLFRRLGAFRGSFSLEAAEAIGADRDLAADDVLGLLSALVARSLVEVVVDDRGSPRYRLPATAAPYAAEKLEHSGESRATRQRHASYFQRLARDADAELDHENVIEALRWLLTVSATEAATLATSLWPTWRRRGHYREARAAFEQAAASGQMSTAVRAQALAGAGEAALLQCEYEAAGEHLTNALELSSALDDRRGSARALQGLGSVALVHGRLDQARDLHAQSLAIWTELDDPLGIAESQNSLGYGARFAGDQPACEWQCLAALAEFRRSARHHDVVDALVNLGASAMYRDELDLARERLAEAVLTARDVGFQHGVAQSLHELAIVARRRRRPLRERAPLLRDALLAHNQLGDRLGVACVLEEISGSLLLRQDPLLAVELLGHVELLREELHAPIPPVQAADQLAVRTRLGANQSHGSFESAWARGRALRLGQAVDRALQAVEQHAEGIVEEPGQGPAPVLTPRELAVLGLVTDGQTNRAIAAALHISASTAGVHVSNILRKLGARRRVDAVGLAHALGVLAIG